MSTEEILMAYEYASTCNDADMKTIIQAAFTFGFDTVVLELLVSELDSKMHPMFLTFYETDKKSLLRYFSDMMLNKEAVKKLLFEIEIIFSLISNDDESLDTILKCISVYKDIASVMGGKYEILVIEEMARQFNNKNLDDSPKVAEIKYALGGYKDMEDEYE
jgi:hypothetical protein